MNVQLSEQELTMLKKEQQDELASTEEYGRVSRIIRDSHNAKY